MRAPFDVASLKGQWMTTEPQAPDLNEMLIVNLDNATGTGTITGSANYANAALGGGGEQYGVSISEGVYSTLLAGPESLQNESRGVVL